MSDVNVSIRTGDEPKPPRMRLSASRLNTWMQCPLQAKFQYIDRLPRKQNAAATFGTCVHAGFQEYNEKNDVEKAVKVFLDMWHHPEKYGIEPESWPKHTSFGNYLNTGLKAIRSYHEKMSLVTRTVLATEHPFLVRFGEYELTGFVDALEIMRNKQGRETLRIVDYKTNGKAPYITNLKLNIQFTIYDYASRQPEFWLGNGVDFPPMNNGPWHWSMVQDMPRQNVWYGVRQDREFDAGERDEADFLRLYRCAREIDKALEHNVFVPNISGDTCNFCSYTVPCKLPFNPAEDTGE